MDKSSSKLCFISNECNQTERTNFYKVRTTPIGHFKYFQYFSTTMRFGICQICQLLKNKLLSASARALKVYMY